MPVRVASSSCSSPRQPESGPAQATNATPCRILSFNCAQVTVEASSHRDLLGIFIVMLQQRVKVSAHGIPNNFRRRMLIMMLASGRPVWNNLHSGVFG